MKLALEVLRISNLAYCNILEDPSSLFRDNGDGNLEKFNRSVNLFLEKVEQSDAEVDLLSEAKKVKFALQDMIAKGGFNDLQYNGGGVARGAATSGAKINESGGDASNVKRDMVSPR